VKVERGKDSAGFRQVRSWRIEGDFFLVESGENGVVREAEEHLSLF
jgi:hypothetical protein